MSEEIKPVVEQQEKPAAPVAKPAGEKKEKKPAVKKANLMDSLVTPDYIKERIEIWEGLKAKHLESLKDMKEEPINITLPDGKVIAGIKGKTTPYDIAKGISRGLADSIVSSMVGDQIWDISRPLESDCNLQLCKFDTEAGKKTFWHSSAHILGQAMERIYGGQLCIGPATAEGFYYDMAMTDKIVNQDDYKLINEVAMKIVQEKQPFERLAVPRDVALTMFKFNKYKTEIISKIPQEETVSLYRCGTLVDLCRGPHVPNTSYIKAFAVTKNSSAYWLGKAENDDLQRVYGVSFPDKKQMEEYENFMREAALRDHRNVGKAQDLFFFHPYSPGSAFFLPHGTRIYNKLVEFIRDEYHKRGFTEVISPSIFSQKLWEQSGHWAKYSENMFNIPTVDNSNFSLKPMNCPGHCLMFGSRQRSYRELPLRFADFGVLHRNELAGALTGLTRVRKFQQDDAHIFCTGEMIEDEINSCLEFMQYVYGIFGFDFTLELSTRPDNYLGEIAQWDVAEASLEKALNKFGKPWKLNPKDGAFYGPKIDIQITDCLKRHHQCATIQLDFQLPIRFDLEYQTDNVNEVKKRPVIIHRAILGSVERMMAILIEHTAGKWPLWVSPRQVIVVTVAAAHNEYGNQVLKQISEAGFYCDIDVSDKTISKKVREAQLAQYNYILVVGQEEINSSTVNVRTRDNVVRGSLSVPDLITEFKQLVKEFK